MSKGLEALEALDYVRMCCSDGLQLPQNQSVEQVVLISDSLATIERELKALEIIKTKNVDISLIKKDLTRLEKLEKTIELLKTKVNMFEIHHGPKSCYYYLYIGGRIVFLTREEYNLLKEVLEDDK